MAKFAKLYDLSDDNQVLVTTQYNVEDDVHELKFETEHGNLQMSMCLGFKTQSEVEDALKNCIIEDAESIRKKIIAY